MSLWHDHHCILGMTGRHQFLIERFQDLIIVRDNVYYMQISRNHLEEEMAAYSSILAWKIPWTEQPGRLQSIGSQRVEHDWVSTSRKYGQVSRKYQEILACIVPSIMTYDVERKLFVYYRGTKRITGTTQLSQLKTRSILILFYWPFLEIVLLKGSIFSLK